MTRTLFANGTIYDGTRAEPTAGDLVVEDGRIVEVGPGLDGDVIVDCSGRWISPGFFDSHVHVVFSGVDYIQMVASPFSLAFYLAAKNLSRTLDIGVTSIRDAGGADLGIKAAIEQGLIRGPRMQISLVMISQTGGHGDSWLPSGVEVPLLPPHPGRPDPIVDGAEEVRKKVRELIRDGADVIKCATSGGVMSPGTNPRLGHFRDDEIAMMVNEAAAAGLSVMAHAQATEGIKTAIRNGVRSIEHGIFLDDEAIEMMIEHGTWLVPTLHAPRAVVAQADAGASIPESSIRKAREVIDTHDDSVRRAHEAGVKIAMGTDCGVGAHGTNLDELRFMNEVGMTPIEVLHATTGSAADLFGVAEDRGRLAPGQRADLVILEGDPADMSDVAAQVREVYLDGALMAPTGTPT
ncbi:MAG: hydrolase [Ilumatobacter coccineus]|uniref:Hydrolase n=1 Tax=Ilumatobacter coccineus TaxID=467094 RepID=A0A2G6K9F8_9ACTN|nr:MAG: hydrolase [Ilumatobacter coccineus]